MTSQCFALVQRKLTAGNFLVHRSCRGCWKRECFPGFRTSAVWQIRIFRSGRQGIRTLTALWPHGLANRPGKPYPATLRKKAKSLAAPRWPALLTGFEPAISTVTRSRGLRTPLQERVEPPAAWRLCRWPVGFEPTHPRFTAGSRSRFGFGHNASTWNRTRNSDFADPCDVRFTIEAAIVPRPGVERFAELP